MNELGKRIRNLRKEENYTLRKLGEKLNMSFSILAMYERGERTPPIDKLLLLADFFSVSTDFLLGRTEKKTINIPELNSENQKQLQRTEKKLMEIPIVNKINSDKTLISENINNDYRIYKKNVSKDDLYFYFKINDNSMRGSRIQADDLVLIKKNAIIQEGDIIALLFNNEIILRRKYHLNNKLILQSNNPNYEPIFVKKDQVDILGKAVRVEFDL